MKKVLFVATITHNIVGFHSPYLKMLKEQGYEVHVASRGNEPIEYCDKHYDLPFERFPLKKNNLRTYKELKKIIKENNYEIIHCHTPVGGVLTRLSAKNARGEGTRVIYTAHGFHFYKGAPFLNWLIYYPIEKYLSKFTDCIITINQEDYDRARKKFKKCKQIELVHGVGVDENKFKFEMTEKEKNKLKEEFNIQKDDYVLTSIGELNKNKNQIMQIKAMRKVIKKKANLKLLIVGKGNLESYLKKKIKKYKLENNIFLLGYRTDIPRLLKISNCILSTSKREGLPVNVIEAIINETPVIATDCRGNRELIKNEINGFIIKSNDIEMLSKLILLKPELNSRNINKARNLVNKYYLENILPELNVIYEGKEIQK